MAREAEDAGFDAILTAEVNSDALAFAQLMGEVTRQIKVGTWIASIHMRHSYACAKAAGLIADATEGRMILGLGMSHQPVNAGLGVEMPAPIEALRRYTTEVAGWLRGEGPTRPVDQHADGRAYLGAQLGSPSHSLSASALAAPKQHLLYSQAGVKSYPNEDRSINEV